MSNNVQNVGRNDIPLSLQLLGTYAHELYAAIGGGNVTLTAQDIIDEAVANGELMQGYKTDNTLVSSAALATDQIYKIDIDLKPIAGGEGAIGEDNRATTSEAVITGVGGATQNMDPGSSRTIGSSNPQVSGFVVPANFASVTVAEGSVIVYTVSLMRAPVDQATL